MRYSTQEVKNFVELEPNTGQPSESNHQLHKLKQVIYALIDVIPEQASMELGAKLYSIKNDYQQTYQGY